MIRLLLLLPVVWMSVQVSSSGCKKSNSPKPADTIPNPPPPPGNPDVLSWKTTSEETILLQAQSTILSFGTTNNSNPTIEVDSTITYQSVDGFGYTLTGGSAYVINHLPAADKQNLLKELFGNDNNSIGISYLRIAVGASDLNSTVFSYDDVPSPQTDVNLLQFSLDPDKTELIPLLKEIIAINPAIKIIAAPWSAPVWMKTNGNSAGGNLQSQYFSVFANYLVKYIQAMKAEGITIDAITPQNEPLNPNNNPSMVMPADDQLLFIKNNLGPAFQTAGITTKIVVYDHNCDVPSYPINILNDPAAKAFIDGSAFHLYAGDISALTQVHNVHPDKNVYFTEQYTASNGSFGGDLRWHLKNVIIGSMRNWSKTALEWNLANDPTYGPHTSGGCTTCKGALTIGGTVTRNVAYYIVAHASKFVPAGSVRIASNITGSLQNVAFKTPAGKKVLIVENDGASSSTFNIKFNNKWVATTLESGAVATYVW